MRRLPGRDKGAPPLLTAALCLVLVLLYLPAGADAAVSLSFAKPSPQRKKRCNHRIFLLASCGDIRRSC